MADKRITQLPLFTTPTLGDEMLINDVLSNFDKKILLSTLRTLLSIPYIQVSISNYDNDSASAVKQGSSFDNKGIPIDIASDLTPTGYAGISVSTTFYLYWDESASAFIYSSTAPTWSDLYQGWYNVDDRALFMMYKDSGGTLYQRKSILLSVSSENELTVKSVEVTLGTEVSGTNVTENDVFDSLSELIPNTGDKCLLSGHSGDVYTIAVVNKYTDSYSWNRAIRTDSNTITISGVLIRKLDSSGTITHSTSLHSVSCDDGNSNSITSSTSGVSYIVPGVKIS